jgi:hypothetical protein
VNVIVAPRVADTIAVGVPEPADTAAAAKSAASAVTGPLASRTVIVQSATPLAGMWLVDVCGVYTHARVDAAVGRENTVMVVLAATPDVASGTVMVSWPLAGRAPGLVSVNVKTVAAAVEVLAVLYPLIAVPVELVASP